MRRTLLALRLALVVSWLMALVAATPTQPISLVVCAPGYPGSTDEAQAAMGALASALAGAAQWPGSALTAIYYPGEKEGLARLSQADAAVALVPVPFFLAHRDELGLTARLSVQTVGGGLTEQWTLVAKKGRVKAAQDLAPMTVISIAGYAPGFVRGALGGWGKLPASTKIESTLQVLSALRKAASGADVVVLLDGAQMASFPSLPFAKDLEVVTRSAPMPSALVATVGKRIPDKRWAELEKALLAMASDSKGGEALKTIRMARFAPLDNTALAAANAAFGGAKQ